MFVLFCVQQHLEERSAGRGHYREPGGSGAPAGQREAGVPGYKQPHAQISLRQIILRGRVSRCLCPDKLMEETEELSHQRAQREVRRPHRPRPPFTSCDQQCLCSGAGATESGPGGGEAEV